MNITKFITDLSKQPKVVTENYRFFFDASFLVHLGSCSVLNDKLLISIRALNRPAIIPFSVVRAVRGLIASTKDSKLIEHVRHIATLIETFAARSLVEILGDDSDPVPESNFVQIFERFKGRYHFVIFTQDDQLSRQMLRQKHPQMAIHVVTLTKWNHGKVLSDLNGFNLYQKLSSEQPPAASELEKAFSNPAEKRPTFQKFTTPRKTDDKPVGKGEIFTQRSVVTDSSGRSFPLGAAIAKGGEGEIFECDATTVAKIYFPERRTNSRAEKLKLMCSRQPKLPTVAWPIRLLVDGRGDFIGYLMPKARGHQMQNSVFGKPRLNRYFPSWDRADLVELALTYAQAVHRVHEYGLIVGDINPMNVLVVSPREIYIVDADSFQVEDFPCPVGMATFRAPEITEPDFAHFLRSERHESFALASLLFMILMCGKSPYSYQGGGDPSENIRAGNFPYANDAKSIPAGAFRYIWSYFPPKIKEAFSATFADPKPEGRPTAQRWTQLLGAYLNYLRKQPPTDDSRALWPGSFRPWGNTSVVQLTCGECSTVFQTSTEDAKRKEKFSKILCGPCREATNLARAAGNSIPCGICQKPIPLHLQARTDIARYCDDCTAPETHRIRSCVGCGTTYTLKSSEISFLWSKSLSLPKRCPECRSVKRARNGM